MEFRSIVQPKSQKNEQKKNRIEASHYELNLLSETCWKILSHFDYIEAVKQKRENQIGFM